MPTTVRLPAKPRILEKHVQEGVTALLELDGWRAIRTDPVSDRARGKGFGEIGMADYLYIRYSDIVACIPPVPIEFMRCEAQVLWIEFKAPGKKAKPHQISWQKRERDRGAMALLVGDFDLFRKWYTASPLNRRIGG